MLEKLIGAQILKINESTIDVRLGEETHTLEILSDDGDCCGYSNFDINMKYSENATTNPIITNIEVKDNSSGDSDGMIVTFYGENKELCEIEADAGSGSGWAYGAIVYMECKTLGIDETLANY